MIYLPGVETLTLPDGTEVDVRIGLGLSINAIRPPAPVVPSPIADWRFEGNLNDSSGNGYTLVVTNGAAGYVASPDGLALGGPGVSCRAEAAPTLPRIDQNPMTLAITAAVLNEFDVSGASVELREGLSSPVGIVVSAETGPTGFSISSTSQTFVNFYETAIAAGTYITVVFVSDGLGNWLAYLNGIEVASGTFTSPSVGMDKTIVIVGDEGEGAIERIRIFNVALTPSQVASLTT